MKKCKDCKIIKNIDEFYGHQGECKVCSCKRIKENRIKKIDYYSKYDFFRNKENYKLICSRKYSMMKQRVLRTSSHRSSAEGKDIISKEEFMEWCYKESNKNSFIKLQKIWKESGYKRTLAPSIDRIDNEKGYSIDNLQWLSLRDNIKKDVDNNRWKNLIRNNRGQFMQKD